MYVCVCARMRDPRGVKAPLNFFPTLSPEADRRKCKCVVRVGWGAQRGQLETRSQVRRVSWEGAERRPLRVQGQRQGLLIGLEPQTWRASSSMPLVTPPRPADRPRILPGSRSVRRTLRAAWQAGAMTPGAGQRPTPQ